MSDFRIKTCVLGPVSTNCYLVYNDTTKEAVAVDPGDNGDYIFKLNAVSLGIKLQAVLLTHGHFRPYRSGSSDSKGPLPFPSMHRKPRMVCWRIRL